MIFIVAVILGTKDIAGHDIVNRNSQFVACNGQPHITVTVITPSPPAKDFTFPKTFA
jgi:hypothetical protein